MLMNDVIMQWSDESRGGRVEIFEQRAKTNVRIRSKHEHGCQFNCVYVCGGQLAKIDC